MSDDMLGEGALAKVAGPLKDFFEKLCGANGQKWLEAFKLFLRGENPWVYKFLRPVAEILIPATENPRNPRELLQTREGLRVSDDFQELVLPHIQRVEETPELTLSMWSLTKPANDAEIMGETGGDPMDATVFGHALVHLLSEQPNGEKGFLPTDGHWIIIHVLAVGEVFAACFFWSDVLLGWRVDARRLRDRRWDEGRHVLSLATA